MRALLAQLIDVVAQDFLADAFFEAPKNGAATRVALEYSMFPLIREGR